MESAEFGHQIDVDRAMKAKERAEKRLAQAASHDESVNVIRAEAALQRALVRLKAVNIK